MKRQLASFMERGYETRRNISNILHVSLDVLIASLTTFCLLVGIQYLIVYRILKHCRSMFLFRESFTSFHYQTKTVDPSWT